ncbi:MAG: histidinol-phosphate transaminase [Oscillospiraceae bacterium]|nr:histidinol-phosphate transaminase [Oscillospiraceae bacterium]MDD6503549.1 histidinol-phosphate transaminase [Oscillospiraceae bacterium]
MSRFFSSKYAALEAYVPGEQPRDQKYIKLNTNESPFPPSPKVTEYAAREAGRLQLYSDPDSTEVTRAVAEHFGLSPRQVLLTNGSDEILNFAFMAFGDAEHPFLFPDITYGFYEVFADLNGIPYETIPLREDWSIDYKAYCGAGKNIVIANPNAPTGLSLPLCEIEEIVRTNPDHVVIVDEAYVDFGGESALPLIEKYDNLLVTRTFSKSRSLAGARLGWGMGQESLMQDLNTIKYSTNPYNINRMTAAAGLAAMEENEYYLQNARTIIATRDRTADALRQLGFAVTDSRTNFLFVSADWISGGDLYRELKARGILIRHWDKPRIGNWCRVTVGTDEEMDAFLAQVTQLRKEVLTNG